MRGFIETLARAWRGEAAGLRRGALGGAAAPRPALVHQDVGASEALIRLSSGEWPEDPDEVPSWRIAQEIHAVTYNYTIPPYRTRREFEAHLEAARKLIEDDPVEWAEALSPQESAQRFLSFLLADATDDTIVLTSNELGQAHVEWCESQRRHPCSDNFFRAAFKALPGVTWRQVSLPGPGRKRTCTFVIRRVERAAMRRAA